MRALLLHVLLLLSACGPDLGPDGEASLNANDYVPAEGRWLQYGPAAAPDQGPFLMIEVLASSWELREGPSWTESVSEETVSFSDEDGLSIDGTTVLPAKLSEGAEQDGTTVVSMGDETVYYGTFSLATRTSVPSGRVSGEWIFARELGPIALTLDGDAWELVYYE